MSSFHVCEHVRSCAANLCDLLRTDVASLPQDEVRAVLWQLVSQVEAQSGREVSRLYAGSYFCDRYFCALGPEGVSRVAEFAEENALALTLVIPIFGQQTLERGERVLSTCLEQLACDEGPLDEVVVNDYGAAGLVSGLRAGTGVRLGWGRLFARALRDPRYAAFSSEAQRAPYDAARARALEAEFGVSLLELDPFAPRVLLGALSGVLPVALHLPHSYVTTGHICELASLGRQVSRKFRPDSACDRACLKTLSVYETRDDGGSPLYFSKQGRTVYFENPNCEADDPAAIERIIWTPDDFGCPHELWQPAASTWWEGASRWA